jgi:hypothetical protein
MQTLVHFTHPKSLDAILPECIEEYPGSMVLTREELDE